MVRFDGGARSGSFLRTKRRATAESDLGRHGESTRTARPPSPSHILHPPGCPSSLARGKGLGYIADELTGATVHGSHTERTVPPTGPASDHFAGFHGQITTHPARIWARLSR